jgi:hypothetical protein
MSMSYTRLEISRSLVRAEILDYLRENQCRLVLSEPPATIAPDWQWFEATGKTGISVNDFANTIYERLVESGKAKQTVVPVTDSTVMNAYNAYFPLYIKTVILEEILDLVRLGILIQVGFKAQRPGINFDFEFDLGKGVVMLTEQGIRFLTEEPDIPYFAEKYFDRLRQTGEPDDELKGYLAEGLACLRNHFGRAAAILLRLAAEHTLSLLTNSTLAVIQDPRERSSLERNINKARMNIEERAEAIFRKLESEQRLVPHRDVVTNRLRPAFHSIRDLGGRAAHLSAVIQLDEVTDHYTLYASSVYTVVMAIIQHQNGLLKMQGVQC